MKAAFYYDIGDFRVEEFSLPKLGPEEALVKVNSCGICGTDVHKAIHKTVKTPIVLGHEVSGEIIELGERVKNFKVGDKVALAHHAGCGVCHYCRKGHHSLCDQYLKTNLDPGGFSTHVSVPAPNVRNTMLHIPEGLSFNEAAFMEPLACCLRGYKKTRFEAGDSVFIYGVGPIGLLFVQLARAFNASEIICSDLMNYRLNYAKDFGATHIINPSKENAVDSVMKITQSKGIDLVIVTVGNVKVYEESTKLLGRGGDILFFAENLKGTFPLDPNIIYKKEACFVGSYSSSPYEYEVGLGMIKNGYLNVKHLITHNFKLEDLNNAINLAKNPEKSLKIMINP
ncbi:MAG: alcohol dehydrogenase catalytic domain-containing protein [Candidatus Helarchaeota archaeon]